MARYRFASTRRLGLPILCGLALFLAILPRVSAQPAIDITGLERQPVRAPAEFLVTGSPLDFESVQAQEFRPLQDSDVNQGISGAEFWIRADLVNRSDTTRRWIIHHETPYIDNVTFYYSDDPATGYAAYRFSDRQTYATRLVDYRKPAFRHATAAGSTTRLYIRMTYDKPDTVSLNLQLWDEDAFYGQLQKENLLHGLYFGILGCLAVIALLAAMALRQRVYLYYTAFLLLSALMWGMLQGFTYQFVWPGSVFLHNEGFHIGFLLFAIAALQFSKAFLHTDTVTPRIHRLFHVLQLIMTVGIVVRLLGVYEPILYLSYASLTILMLLPLVGLIAWRKGLRYARWYTFAWLAYGTGLILNVISASTPLLHWGMQPLLYGQVGSLLEAILLMVALSERLLNWDRDRHDALLLAQHDPLTGLGNRRLLETAWQDQRNRQALNRQPIFLLLMDLDHFKEINDRHGHEAGDEALRTVARILLEHSRADDVCVRYGGEEFAILLQAPDERVVLDLAERLRHQCEITEIQYGDAVIRLTLSAGLAESSQDWDEHAYETLQKRADVALYHSKVTGRNRITLYGPDLGSGATRLHSSPCGSTDADGKQQYGTSTH